MDHFPTWLHSSNLHAWDTDCIGYFASALVAATFLMKSMIPLRITAMMSNVAFIYYAVTVDLRPILVLHSILLPVNIFRLAQILIGRRRLGRASTGLTGGTVRAPNVTFSRNEERRPFAAMIILADRHSGPWARFPSRISQGEVGYSAAVEHRRSMALRAWKRFAGRSG